MLPEGGDLGAALENDWSVPVVMYEAYARLTIHASPGGTQKWAFAEQSDMAQKASGARFIARL
jgi:hypothetical protein